jgi:hypothetical protein
MINDLGTTVLDRWTAADLLLDRAEEVVGVLAVVSVRSYF